MQIWSTNILCAAPLGLWSSLSLRTPLFYRRVFTNPHPHSFRLDQTRLPHLHFASERRHQPTPAQSMMTLCALRSHIVLRPSLRWHAGRCLRILHAVNALCVGVRQGYLFFIPSRDESLFPRLDSFIHYSLFFLASSASNSRAYGSPLPYPTIPTRPCNNGHVG